MDNTTFQDNVIIITGASRGIGRELACQLAGQGAWLSLAARDGEALEAVAAQCRQRSAKALPVPTDVSDEAQCARLIEQTVAAFGRIDTLINNAGVTMWTRFDALQTLAPLEHIMRVNYFGSVYCTYYALPYLRQSRGRIVGISSLTGKTGVPTRSGYAASKHAMVGFFDSLRIELMDTGVTVTLIYPGFVATDVRRSALGADGVPLGTSPLREDEVMTVEDCVAQIVPAIAKRQRELVMTFRGRVGQWLKLIAPRWVDRIAKNAIERGH